MNEFKINIRVEGIKELTEAVLALAGAGIEGGHAMPTGTASVPVNQMAASAQLWGMPAPGTVPQNYGQPPQQQGMPAGAAMQLPVNQAAPAPTVPTTAMPQEFTIEQLQVAAAGLSGMGKMPQVMGILQQFGIQAMTELPRERYGEFAIALREAGAQI